MGWDATSKTLRNPTKQAIVEQTLKKTYQIFILTL